MADTAHMHDTGLSTHLMRPPLEVVRDVAAALPPATQEAAPAEPDVGRAAMVGAVVGFLAVTAVITVAGTLGGIGAASAFGLGVYVGFFGGGGFGFMMGATIPLARHFDARRTGRSTHHAQGDDHDAAAR